MTLRHLITDPHLSAAPAKCLGGAVLVINTQTARKLGITLAGLEAIIQADYETIYEPKDAKTRADRAVEPL